MVILLERARPTFIVKVCRRNLVRLPDKLSHQKSKLVTDTSMDSNAQGAYPMVTSILPVDPSKIANAKSSSSGPLFPQDSSFQLQPDSPDAKNLLRAASELRETDVPVAFPTETVYGLGADVTRSSAVLGIFKAKQRPSDNPLIVHISSLQQLRALLSPNNRENHANGAMQASGCETVPRLSAPQPSPALGDQPYADPIPVIYQPLIKRFWPGPLTLIMPNPNPSVLAPEVTAGLDTFGVRMPKSVVAQALICLANVPLAAPSANASSKPSPTTAAHVKDDLNGRISTIIDGGPCDVGVESTVVDGLNDPPSILRPGGISIDQLRSCPGWENVTIGYEDAVEAQSQPRAPGMKYKHYSPRARVILYGFGHPQPSLEDISMQGKTIGVIRTRTWKRVAGVLESSGAPFRVGNKEMEIVFDDSSLAAEETRLLGSRAATAISMARKVDVEVADRAKPMELWDVDLGCSSDGIAKGLFSALRELDKENVDAILVEGIDTAGGGAAAAVMNRLRKAAETFVPSIPNDAMRGVVEKVGIP